MRVIASFLFYFLCSIVLLIGLVIVALVGLEIVNMLIKDLTGVDLGKKIGGRNENI